MPTLDQIWADLRRWGRAIGRFIIGQLLAEGPALRQARRAVLHQIEEATNNYSDEAERLQNIAEGLTLDDLRRYVSFDMERRKSIEDKAKANLLAITIGFTVLFASLNVVGKRAWDVAVGRPWTVSSFIFLTIGVSYLIYGGLKAIDALQIARIYSPSPADESGVCEAVRKIKLLWCLQQNERTSLLRTNAISVSYRSIRNGVISLAALVLIIAAHAAT
jgi:hypothetical protein